MRLLVLGGTRFLGRAIVDEAVSRGHDVTTFSRGISGHSRPGVRALHGDRANEGDLRQLARDTWDAAIDTSVLAPVHVLASARILAGQVRHCTYVSTVSVYEDRPNETITEDSPVLDCPADAAGTVETLGYGELKAGSERAIAETMPGRALIVRPGLIVGPHENVGRLPWWLVRFARGGAVLAPGGPERTLRVTDARDLAAWLIDNTRRGIPGTVNVPGPEGTTIGQLMAACEQATRPDREAPAEVAWVPDRVLLEAGVEPWMQLPMWAPDIPGLAGVWRIAGDRALRTGMRYRPLADTVHDTWLWLKQEASATGRPIGEFERHPSIGLDPAWEQEILSRL